MTSMRQVWCALPKPNPVKCACCGVFAYISSTFMASKLVQCVKCGCFWQLICKNNCTCGLEHGQPHREPCLKLSLMAFLWFLTPPGTNQAKNGVSVVGLMFLYEARARARAGLVRTFKTQKTFQVARTKLFRAFLSIRSISRARVAWLSHDSWVGKGGSRQAGACRQAVNFLTQISVSTDSLGYVYICIHASHRRVQQRQQRQQQQQQQAGNNSIPSTCYSGS